MASFQAKTGRDSQRKRKKKFIVPISYYPTRNRKFQKNSKKIQKINKHHYVFISNQNGSGEAEKEWKKKLSFWSVPTQPGIENSKTIAKKLKNIIMASFQAKTGWDSLWKRKKNYRSDQLLPDQE